MYVDFLKVARFSLNGPGTELSLARSSSDDRASKQGTRQRFALFEPDL